MAEPEPRRRLPALAVALVLLVAVVLVALGAWALYTGIDTGRTRHGYTMSIEGDGARWRGLSHVAVGLAMLAVLMKTRRAALWIRYRVTRHTKATKRRKVYWMTRNRSASRRTAASTSFWMSSICAT